ncbi:MAG: hypothetical protein U5N53_10520 [Mycobacterium sp.]|nr:hypothetical protein [Mycobacterium sp.]
MNGRWTHSGDAKLAAHVAAAVIRVTPEVCGWTRHPGPAPHQKIDLAACLVMAYSCATWRANPQEPKESKEFRMTRDELVIEMMQRLNEPAARMPSWTATPPASNSWRS